MRTEPITSSLKLEETTNTGNTNCWLQGKNRKEEVVPNRETLHDTITFSRTCSFFHGQLSSCLSMMRYTSLIYNFSIFLVGCCNIDFFHWQVNVKKLTRCLDDFHSKIKYGWKIKSSNSRSAGSV